MNCYRMFAELLEVLVGGRALDKGERLTASSAPGHKHFRHLVVQFLLEDSDLATEMTPKASSTCKHRHAKRARVIFLVIGSRSIRRTVHSNDLVKFFGGLRCTARRKLEIYNL